MLFNRSCYWQPIKRCRFGLPPLLRAFRFKLCVASCWGLLSFWPERNLELQTFVLEVHVTAILPFDCILCVPTKHRKEQGTLSPLSSISELNYSYNELGSKIKGTRDPFA